MYTPEYFVFKRGDDSLWLSRKPEMKSILKKGQYSCDIDTYTHL